MAQRILVCGGRDFDKRGIVFSALDLVHELNPIALLIHGGAKGADTLAEMWAWNRGVRTQPFQAEWREFGKRAGPIRNQAMLDIGKPDLVVAFPGGKGTADMVARATSAGVAVSHVTPHLRDR